MLGSEQGERSPLQGQWRRHVLKVLRRPLGVKEAAGRRWGPRIEVDLGSTVERLQKHMRLFEGVENALLLQWK